MIVSRQFTEKLVLLLISTLLMYYSTIFIMEKTNGLENNFDQQKQNLDYLESKLNKKINLNMYEKTLLNSIIHSKDINISLDDIGGHDDIKCKLKKLLFKPLEMYNDKNGILFSPPNGIILYGEPGTGKTMFAKAIAKKMNGIFISCDPTCFENKYYGESSKIIKSLFSLANKINPCIIFIDEIDGILGSRNDLDQSFVNETKTIFLSEMDGIISKSPNVLCIGATNRLYSIDKAVKRRMRLHIEVPLPDQNSREKILNLHLSKYKIDLSQILKDTDGFSGSDLFELCKLSALESLSNDRNNILIEDVNIQLRRIIS